MNRFTMVITDIPDREKVVAEVWAEKKVLKS